MMLDRSSMPILAGRKACAKLEEIQMAEEKPLLVLCKTAAIQD